MQKSWLLIFLTLIMLNTAYSLVEQDLYNVEVQVPSREISLEQKKIFVQQEFPKLLYKITGNPNSLPIDNADQYVTQFSFIDNTNEQTMLDGKPNLKISFDKSLISKALTTNNQQFLGENRPLTIIWLKASPDIEQELLKQIIDSTKIYSLPIVFPMFDLKEVEILQQGVVNEQLIKQASTRYSADEIIMMDLSQKENNLHLTWKSLTTDWQLSATDNTSNITAQANFFVEKLMEHLIKNYASNNNKSIPKEVILIKIANVINLEDYVKIENYLQNLEVTKNIHATKFQSGEVEFEMVANGGKQAIRSAIATNTLLRENYKHSPLDHNTLFYTLQL